MASLIHVKGLSELQKFLDQLPGKIQNNIMRGALRAGANVVKKQAQQNINSHSGELAKSLKVSARIDRRNGRVVASLKPKGPHAYKGRFVEYGTRPHTISPRNKTGALNINSKFRGTVSHPGAKPHPFLRPALDARARDATVAVGNYIKKRLATKHGINTADIQIGDE